MDGTSPFTIPLRIVPRLPRTTVVAAAFGYAAILITLLAVWPWTWPLACSVGAVLLSAVALWFEMSALPRTCVACLLDSAGQWHLIARDGTRQRAQPGARAWTTRWLLLVPLRVGRRRVVLLVTREMLAPTQWRRLRVRLRYESAMRSTAS